MKFRISAAIDSGKPLPPALSKAIARSGELRQSEARTRELEQRLTQSRPEPEPQPFLHEAIMRAVAQAGERASARRSSWGLGWLAAPAAAVLAGVALWSVFRPDAPAPDPHALAALSSTLDLGGDMTRNATANLLAPLSDELDRVNHDLDTTEQFLLASVP